MWVGNEVGVLVLYYVMMFYSLVLCGIISIGQG